MEYTFLDSFMTGGDWEFLAICASPYTSLLGNYFYLIFGLIPVYMTYLKAQDVILPTMLGLLFTAAFGMYFPETLGVALLMFLGTAIGSIMFQVFKGRGD